ncbi:fumarylacetoacetase [Aquabacterium sp.]|uniref:fumarylacetoacetase n=1 Tax=Aquabacterium sp. TaxID=1872578 RepID=UPI002BE57283|nr:fumarylacetoacetase [Aquabacterium sp.]HSW04060.1 fumarylacetoacetase [Aquabacterium sp.]
MTTTLDFTHDSGARSWVESANAAGTDFPLQNLPFAVFRPPHGTSKQFRGGVAIGDQVLDLAGLAATALLQGDAQKAAAAAAGTTLNGLCAQGPAAWRALRQALFALLRSDASAAQQAAMRVLLSPQALAEYTLPTRIGNYTDFYTSIHHARNTGRVMRGDTGVDLVSPNFRSMPIAYHGRASSVIISGQSVRRPKGQRLPPGDSAPVFGPTRRLDYELELGVLIGRGNALGEPIALADAEAQVFGIVLLNDWSARDIQAWEMAPLGPFLAKNFATSISPWVVTLAALAPYRQAWEPDAQAPPLLDYLDDAGVRARGALDIQLEAWLQPAGGEAQRLSQTSFRHQSWTVPQMIAHHTVGGCNLQPGDLLGTGTISGPEASEAGTMIEITHGGRQPLTLADGTQRGFLEDGDALMLRGWCERPGAARIGFGECRGVVLPAV